jgi:hypothetical protein
MPEPVVQVGAGVPGGFPLPNSGAPGTAYTSAQRMHPAAMTGRGMSNGGMPPAVAGAKK